MKLPGTIHFIGVGGIGMSALARYFNVNGCAVTGYDRQKSALTIQLENEGISVHYEDNPAQAGKPDLVVYTPAIPQSNKQLSYFRSSAIPLKKRAQVLGEVTKSMFTIAVAGSHGKTTVSTLIARILEESGKGCTAFLGGICLDFNSNFINTSDQFAVVEADEYDRSFLQLHPNAAVVTAIDSDHLDIYGTHENLLRSFSDFKNCIKLEGFVIQKLNCGLGTNGLPNTYTYSLTEPAQFHSSNIVAGEGLYHFNITGPDFDWQDIALSIGGRHNVENAVAAIALTKQLGVEESAIRNALANVKGIARRFEYVLKSDEVIMVDDYAHHPAEVDMLLKSVKELYPAKKLTAVFQPHLYSRTRDLADGFAQSLNLADELFLLPIYPAREEPIDGVSSAMIVQKMDSKAKVVDKDQLLNELSSSTKELVVTIGAGDISELVPLIKQKIQGI